MTFIKIASKLGKTSLQKVRRKDSIPWDFQNKKGVIEAVWRFKNLDFILSLEN